MPKRKSRRTTKRNQISRSTKPRLSRNTLEARFQSTHEAFAKHNTQRQIDAAILDLRKALAEARLHGESNLWAGGATDLAGFLWKSGRGDRTRNPAEAVGLLDETSKYYRSAGNTPALGISLTNLAMCRIEALPTDKHRALAIAELEKAMPIRTSKAEQAYTTTVLAAALREANVKSPQDKSAILARALQLSEAAVFALEKISGEEPTLMEAILVKSDVVYSTVKLEQEIEILIVLHKHGKSGDFDPNLPMVQFRSQLATACLAASNPSFFDLGFDRSQGCWLFELPLSSARSQIVDDTLKELNVAQAWFQRRGNRIKWSATQALSAKFLSFQHGPDSDQAVEARWAAVQGLIVEDDPARCMTWAADSMGDAAARSDWARAVEAGELAWLASELALSDQQSEETKRKVLTQLPVVSRRLSYCLMKVGRTEDAVVVLESGRQRLLRGPDAVSSLESMLEVVKQIDTAIVYLLVGPESVYFILLDIAKHVEVLEYTKLGGRDIVKLVTGTSDTSLGIIQAQKIGGHILQASINRACVVLTPMMHSLHNWLEDSGVSSIALIATGPYVLLPLHLVPITDFNSLHTPFGWFRTCSMLPSVTSIIRALAKGTSPAGRRRIVLAADPARDDLPKLGAASEECFAIARQFGVRDWSVDLLRGDEVTADGLSILIDGADILHFAGHAKSDPVDENEIFLYLADGDLKISNIGHLLHQAPRILVLSACQSGHMSTLQIPDEAIGLASAAMTSGVRCVVGSLWRVDDHATGLLMRRLYDELADLPDTDFAAPMLVTSALRRAQQWLATATEKELGKRSIWPKKSSNVPYSDSRYWGAFVTIGV